MVRYFVVNFSGRNFDDHWQKEIVELAEKELKQRNVYTKEYIQEKIQEKRKEEEKKKIECPNCKLVNPDTVLRCECGYKFTKDPEFFWFILVEFAVFFMSGLYFRNTTLLDFIILGIIGLPLWLVCENRVARYLFSLIVFVITVVFVFGIVCSDPKTIAGIVLEKCTEDRGVEVTDWHYFVKIRYKDTKEEPLTVDIFEPLYNELFVGQQVELKYHIESFSGIFGRWVVVDSINSEMVRLSGSRGFHGTGFEQFMTTLTLLISMTPLFFLMYIDCSLKKLFKKMINY